MKPWLINEDMHDREDSPYLQEVNRTNIFPKRDVSSVSYKPNGIDFDNIYFE
jgi:hypothetical protein